MLRAPELGQKILKGIYDIHKVGPRKQRGEGHTEEPGAGLSCSARTPPLPAGTHSDSALLPVRREGGLW